MASGTGGGGAGATDDTQDGGAGTGGIVWPLGVYVVKDGQVRWVPALDATRVALAGLALIRIFIKLRGRRPKN